MEKTADSVLKADNGSAAKRGFFSRWLPYAVAVCLMAWGIFQTWRVLHLKRELVEQQVNLEAIQARKAEIEERKSLAALRLTLLPAKDPAYTLASIAVAWNPALNEGIVTLRNLPAPPAGRDYQLWVLDPKAPAPLNAGVINIATVSRHFTAGSVSISGPGFAVSLEPGGGVSAPTGPILFAVAPQE